MSSVIPPSSSFPPSTPAISYLLSHSIPFTCHSFDYVPGGGTAVSSACLGVSECSVIKTLIFHDRTARLPFVILQHGDRSVDSKALYRCLSAMEIPNFPIKRGGLEMVPVETAESVSGYLTGGCSPFGLLTHMPLFIESSITQLNEIFINGGRRGLLVRLLVSDLLKVLDYRLVECKTENKKTKSGQVGKEENKDNNHEKQDKEEKEKTNKENKAALNCDSDEELSARFSGWPLSIEFSPAVGRYLLVTRLFPVGSLVFSTYCFARGASESHKKRFCHTCAQYKNGGKFEISCNQCGGVYFCSPECMKTACSTLDKLEVPLDQPNGLGLYSAFHPYECAAIKRLQSCKLDKEAQTILKVWIQISARKVYERDFKTKFGDENWPKMIGNNSQLFAFPNFKDFSFLVSHGEQRSEHSKSLDPGGIPYSRELLKAARKLTEGLPIQVEKSSFYLELGQIEANSFGLWADKNSQIGNENKSQQNQKEAEEEDGEDEKKVEASSTSDESPLSPSTTSSCETNAPSKLSVGRAVYPLCSLFNHSCDPNCHVLQVGNCLSVYAIKPIENSSECTISYIDPNRPLAARRQDLMSNFNFLCQCSRCQREEKEKEAGESVSLSYATAESRAKSGKKHQPPKKKKIQPKKIDQEIANIRIY
jgi:Cys-tRNA(Pro) deacylase